VYLWSFNKHNDIEELFVYWSVVYRSCSVGWWWSFCAFFVCVRDEIMCLV